MRNKKKGFTLIELLAVIVVLAIIALIATPIILGVIDKAKIGAAKSSVFGYADAVEKSYVIAQTNGTISSWPASDENGCYIVSDIKEFVKVKGKQLTDDTKVCLNEKHIVITISGKVDGYEFTYEDNKVTIGDKSTEVVEVLEGDPIGTITQTLINNNTGNTYNYMNGTYLKGVQESNYVWYNGFLWRIMGKNEDGSIRLITEENVAGVPYGASGQGLTYSSNTGYLNNWLNDYFYNNLDSSKTDIIKEADWCINPYNGTYTAGTAPARTDCTDGTTFNAKVGLITLDEYNLSGASQTNATYGLVNSQYFRTLTPYSASLAWDVYSSGSADYFYVHITLGARPVINVDTTATITGGDGTLGDAYILNQTIDFKTGKLNDKASSGEYVSLSGKTYRVVSKDSIGTKLIYDGYYEEVSGTPTMMAYNPTSTNVFSTTTGIGQKLNGDILNWLTNNNQTIKDKIVPTTWYQTNGFGYGTAYTTILNDTSNPITETKVGLIRVGEMLSGQSASILTKNYTVRSAYGNAKNYWTMNKYTSVSSAWNVYYFGHASYNDVSNAYGARPVIYVNTDTTITSGNGTLESPYIID